MDRIKSIFTRTFFENSDNIMYTMKKYLALLIFIVSIVENVWSQPLPTVTKHTIIIDTDCAMDDMRAISILLTRPEITVKAIIVCDGTLPPEEGVQKIKALLHELGRDTFQVACGKDLKGLNPSWREFNRSVQ
jgi:hypothetical protein